MPASPKIGVAAAILNHQGELLIVQRGHPPEQGLWALPGGRVEWGESLAGALCREISEEVHLHIAPGPLLHVAEIVTPTVHFIVLDYAATVIGQESLRPDSDALSACWISPQDIGSRDWAAGMDQFFASKAVRDYLCL
ncbi:MAG: NUDIX hydrolase [Sulfobacillus thermosulfidooxidans]|uniref:Nudix hydrolase domain-containing protein n=1 Tax=Sulfobacillus thermotolerans TaxID=338644 RepID=A0ABM6RQM4_9FIRM|nr:hypothetical protein BXT84_06785 [Sulfobacillus thermotolerans]MCY0907230.1 NUDIX domain-containing protein [Sulfobacillus thermotolerans]PSR37476.1 MAG: NUDIX hydrolase [Sulfobacillus thermosulfidooxidans]